MKLNQLKWMREPASYSVTSDKIGIITKPHTAICGKELIIILEMTTFRFFRWKRKINIFHLR